MIKDIINTSFINSHNIFVATKEFKNEGGSILLYFHYYIIDLVEEKGFVDKTFHLKEITDIESFLQNPESNFREIKVRHCKTIFSLVGKPFVIN